MSTLKLKTNQSKNSDYFFKQVTLSFKETLRPRL